MPSLKDLLSRTMLFTAAKDGGVDAYTSRKHGPGDPIVFVPPALSPGTPVADRAIWSWTHDPGSPAKITNLVSLVHAMGMPMPVADSVEVESVSVKLLPGDPVIDLPLTPAFVVAKYSIDGGVMNDRKKGWWQLPANVDQSILVVFGYELALADGADPKPLTLDAIEKLGDKFFPIPDVPADDPDGTPKPKPNTDPDAGAVSVEVGQEVTAFVAPPWVIVAFGLTTCKERPDFEPGAILGAGRFYPHVMVACNQPLDSAETKIKITRPAKVMMMGSEGLPDVKGIFVEDTNETHATLSALKLPFIGRAPPLPIWSDFFDYYDLDPAIGTELKFVDPSKTGTRTVSKGILRETNRLGGFGSTIYEKSTSFIKLPRQGAFDSIHLAPRMTFSNPTTGFKIAEVAMAPFCEHDCLHTHTRWGMPIPEVPKSNLGFDGRKPYAALGAPLVPANQAVFITLLSPSTLRYRAVASNPIGAGSWTVFNHHGSAYALAIADPGSFRKARFGIAATVIQFNEPFTRATGIISPIFDREIIDVEPQASLAALYHRLQFTGTASPDVFMPRIKILDLDLCRRT